MRFVVVEYSSKSGSIWRHTDEKPNYLCDPDKEMDPTSFGCYVSALKGEHIPLTWLIGGHKITNRFYRKVSGHWPRNYFLHYLKNFDVLMIVHQISNGPEITAFAKRVRKELPQIKILGVATQPYGILKEYWEKHPRWLRDFQEFMDACHVYVTIVKHTKPLWQKLTRSHVEYLPQPYPVAHALQFYQSLNNKSKIFFVAGVTSRFDIKRGQLVAKKLQQEFPDFVIHLTRIPGVYLDTANLQGARFKIIPFGPWQKHLSFLSRTILTVNTDYTLTRGRVQVDCAAVGTPSIGADSDGQTDLWLSLPASQSSTVEDLVHQGRRLLTDQRFYEQATSNARERLQVYTYEQSAARLCQLIQSMQ